VVDSEARGGGRVEALARLSSFRAVFYGCLSARGDELFELTDGAPRGAGVPDGGERPPIFPSS
jgi:hypothetical protein